MEQQAIPDVLEGESPTGWWKLVGQPPRRPLASLVDRLIGYQERSETTAARTERATSAIPLIISFGDELEIDMAGQTGQRFESFVGGFHAGPATAAASSASRSTSRR